MLPHIPGKFGPNEYIHRWLDNVHGVNHSNVVEPSTFTDREANGPGSQGLAGALQKLSYDRLPRKRKCSSSPTPSELPHRRDTSPRDCSDDPEQAIKGHASVPLVSHMAAPHAQRKKAHNKILDGKKYEKRTRHKTKPDKYELKPDRNAKRKSDGGKATNERQRKRRKKSGAALNDEFHAPNIDQNRLSLKPNSNPGLFSKGKASSPQQRRGLPDLTFAEMTFLSRRRELDKEKYAKQKELQAMKRKSHTQANKEVSDYFSKPLNSTFHAEDHPQSNISHTSNSHPWSIFQSVSSPAKLNDFSNPGQWQTLEQQQRRPLSDTKLSGRRSVNGNANHIIGTKTSPAPVRNEKQTQTSNHNGTETYVSWSTSPPREVPKSQPTKCIGAENCSERMRRHLSQHSLADKIPPLENMLVSRCTEQGSSVSNPSLAALARESLRAGAGEARNHSHRENPYPDAYSLDDLRDIARLPSLLATSSKLPTGGTEPADQEKLLYDAPSRTCPKVYPRVRDLKADKLTTSSKAAAQLDRRGHYHHSIHFAGARNVDGAPPSEPRFLGEFRISPSKVQTLLSRPTLLSPLRHQRSTASRSPFKGPNSGAFFVHSPARNLGSQTDYLNTAQNANKDHVLLPVVDERSYSPQLPTFYQYDAHDLGHQKANDLLPSELAQDLFPLNETDLLGCQADLRNSIANDASRLTPQAAYLAEQANLPMSCLDSTIPDLNSFPKAELRLASPHDGGRETLDHHLAHSATKPHMPVWHSCSKSFPDSGDGWVGYPDEDSDLQSRPKLLRVTDRQGNLRVNGEDPMLMEGFWRPRMLY